MVDGMFLATLSNNIGRLVNKGFFSGCVGVDFRICLVFQWIQLEMGVLVDPQLCDLCGASLPGAFFCQKNTPCKKKHDF